MMRRSFLFCCVAAALLGAVAPWAAAARLPKSLALQRDAVVAGVVVPINLLPQVNFTAPIKINVSTCVFDAVSDVCSANPAAMMAVNLTAPIAGDELLLAAAARMFACANYTTETDCLANPDFGCAFYADTATCAFAVTADSLQSLGTCSRSVQSTHVACQALKQEACMTAPDCTYVASLEGGFNATVANATVPAAGACMAAALLDMALDSGNSNTTLADIMATPDFTGDCPGAVAMTKLAAACNSTDCTLLTDLAIVLGGEQLSSYMRSSEDQCAIATGATAADCVSMGATEVAGDALLSGLRYRGGAPPAQPTAAIEALTPGAAAPAAAPSPAVSSAFKADTRIVNYAANSAAPGSTTAAAAASVLAAVAAVALLM